MEILEDLSWEALGILVYPIWEALGILEYPSWEVVEILENPSWECLEILKNSSCRSSTFFSRAASEIFYEGWVTDDIMPVRLFCNSCVTLTLAATNAWMTSAHWSHRPHY